MTRSLISLKKANSKAKGDRSTDLEDARNDDRQKVPHLLDVRYGFNDAQLDPECQESRQGVVAHDEGQYDGDRHLHREQGGYDQGTVLGRCCHLGW